MMWILLSAVHHCGKLL